MAYEIREMKLGGILDQGIAVLKDNFKLLLGIMLYAYIPFQLISTFVQIAVLPEIIAPNPNPNAPPEIDVNALYQALPIIAAFYLVLMLVIVPLTNAAVIYGLAQRYLGRDVTAGEAVKKGLSKVLPLLGTSILVFLAVLGGTLLCIIPGILFALWFSLYYQVVVLEDFAGAGAMGRSKRLVTPYIGTLLVLMIIIFVVSAAINGTAGAIPQVYIRGVLAVLVGAVMTMFSSSVFVVFYFSCRSGVENFDLELLAESVEESVADDSERSPFDEETF